MLQPIKMESSNCDIEFFHIACWHHHEKKREKHAQKHSLQVGHLPVLNMAFHPTSSYFHGDPGSPKLRMGAWNLHTILRSLGTPQSSSENLGDPRHPIYNDPFGGPQLVL